ncbi:maleylpyruvate isomerase family mycothiol-dependent enzyme [Amycolatopsis sp. NPDC101161]|uniref:maleylpyruvate isomerase family mycothiol-dependent enzyme n=1 Tax=Amycolatopsis sp. NPDC101161 TaxID=3363940 RepID=UPI00381C8B59
MPRIRTTHALTIARPDREEVARVGFAELSALEALLGSLGEEDWRRPTASGWTVHEMVAHLVGQHVETARPWTIASRVRAARKRFPSMSALDAHNALQVATFGSLSGDELRAWLAQVGPRAVRMRRRAPSFVRRQRTDRTFPGESLVEPELAYVMDVLSNRDTWLHRLEIARATGREFAVGADDGLVVAQVVRDLALRWSGPALVMDLSGPAGGSWQLGEGEPVAWARAGALDHLWHLSGRPGSPDPEVTGDPAAAEALRAARVVF